MSEKNDNNKRKIINIDSIKGTLNIYDGNNKITIKNSNNDVNIYGGSNEIIIDNHVENIPIGKKNNQDEEKTAAIIDNKDGTLNTIASLDKNFIDMMLSIFSLTTKDENYNKTNNEEKKWYMLFFSILNENNIKYEKFNIQNSCICDNLYMIEIEFDKNFIKKILSTITTQNISSDSLAWLEKKDKMKEFSIIILIPSASVFFHPELFYSNINKKVYIPIDLKYLNYDFKYNHLVQGGMVKEMNYLYEIFINNNCKIIEKKTYHNLDKFEIGLIPNYWNANLENINICPSSKLLLERFKQIKYYRSMWHRMSTEKKKQAYTKLLKNDTTNRKYAKVIVPFLLYKNIQCHQSKFINVNKLEYGEKVVIRILDKNNLNGESIDLGIISVTKVDLNGKYKKLNKLLENSMELLSNGLKSIRSVRESDGQLGNMYVFGQHAKRSSKNNKIGFYLGTNEFEKNDLLKNLMTEYKKMLKDILPIEVSIIEKYPDCYNENIPEIMGGVNGITKSINCSKGLCNPPHLDVNDLGIGISIWTEEKIGMAENWEFILPSLVDDLSDRKIEGIRVGLCHGALISWHGNYRHCSTIGEVGLNNEVYGWHISNNLPSLKGFLSENEKKKN